MTTGRKTDGSYPRGNEYGVTAAQEHVLATELQDMYLTVVAGIVRKFAIGKKNAMLFKKTESDSRWELWLDGCMLAGAEVVSSRSGAKVWTEYSVAGLEYLRKNRLSEQA